jgi:hypothetical protein
MYGNHRVFTQHAKNGCREVQFGTGPWVGENRMVGIFLFHFPKGVIKSYETWKSREFGSTHRGTSENTYSRKYLGDLVKKWKLCVGDRVLLADILKKWTGGLEFD